MEEILEEKKKKIEDRSLVKMRLRVQPLVCQY